MALRTVPLHKCTQKALFLGGDRELVMTTGLLAVTLAATDPHVWTFLLAFLIWFCGLFLFRWMAKHDPLLRDVYLRSLRYGRYYSARSTPFRRN